MIRKNWIILMVLIMVLLLCGCSGRTVEDMYAPPRRSDVFNELQTAIDRAMVDMEYAAPVSGENRQTVQMADLDGDGVEEYILFARAVSEIPLRILIFRQEADEECVLFQVIQSAGAAFEQVEYADLDGKPGCEIVVGRQVSDQLQRSLSVFSFAGGEARQLLSAGYNKYLSCDLNADGLRDLMLLRSGETETDMGHAVLYTYADDALQRSREAELSRQGTSIKRITAGKLHGGESAVFVASAVEENAILTDVFTLKDGEFTNISFSSEAGTSVQTLRNYYVYGDDLNDDGIMELPYLISMKATMGEDTGEQHLIRWYSLDIDGREINKLYTYHNYAGGWYLDLSSDWAPRVSVVQEGSIYTFYLWDEGYATAQVLFTISCFTGSSREEQAVQEGRFLLHRSDAAAFACELSDLAAEMEVTEDDMINSFRLIHRDWNTGET